MSDISKQTDIGDIKQRNYQVSKEEVDKLEFGDVASMEI